MDDGWVGLGWIHPDEIAARRERSRPNHHDAV
jgi:hypothetical protein